MKQFDLDDTVKCKATFGVSNTLTNPSTVRYEIVDPDANLTTYTYGTDSEVTRTSTGLYVLTIQLSTEGQWSIRAICTGTVIGARETTVLVGPSSF